MTSAHKTLSNKPSPPHSGFTLLEIVITLAIITTLLGSSILFFLGETKQNLEQTSQQTQLLAKHTMREARELQRPLSILFTNKHIWVVPESSPVTKEPPSLEDSISVDENITISYLIDNEQGWTILEPNSQPLVWTFTGTGICQALSLRFENDIATDEIDFHPLTAGKISNAN
jgi:prepilin-type N-terminal cleavage/methylation domain-containing protein